MSRRKMRSLSSALRSAGFSALMPSFARRLRIQGVNLPSGQSALARKFVAQRVFVHDAGVDGRGQQVVGRAHGVDVAGEVQVKVLHGHDLGSSRRRQRRP